MDVALQIKSGALVCPKSKARLYLEGACLRSESGESYPMHDARTPILVIDPEWADQYSRDSALMNGEYDSKAVATKPSLFKRIKSSPALAYRSESSRKAFDKVFGMLDEGALCVSVGGGPLRVHPLFTNLNIGPFPNVDVVADAHHLPYATGSVDAVYSEAVFEHLSDPSVAAKEIERVLKPGGLAFVCTPFMQAYHGYPHHYYNYTITGHQKLFESAGLNIIDAGVCVGPAHALADLISQFVREFAPFNKVARLMWGATRVLLAPLVRHMDKRLSLRENAHVLASTTYLVAEKSR